MIEFVIGMVPDSVRQWVETTDDPRVKHYRSRDWDGRFTRQYYVEAETYNEMADVILDITSPGVSIMSFPQNEPGVVLTHVLDNLIVTKIDDGSDA